MPLKSIDHITINSADIAKTRAFYVDLLGFTFQERGNATMSGGWLYLDGHPFVHVSHRRAERVGRLRIAECGLVREAKGVNPKLRAVAALNAADAQGHDNDEALSVLRETEGVEALPSMLIRRKAYRNAAAQGRGVTDMNPKDPKAVEEMQALVRAIFPTAE